MSHCRMAVLGAALTACVAAIPASAQKTFARPPYAGAYEPQGIDERGLWMEYDEDERVLQASPSVVRDGALSDFVRGVLCRTVGDDRCRGVRLYIVKDASFNATMSPNGIMVVHTGLLARLHSEAELAAVLGHEFGDFEQRHGLKRFRAQRGAGDVMNWISLIGAVTNTPTASTNNAIVAGYFRFNRNEETEADLLGVQFVRSSHYRLRASRVWIRLVAEEDALRAERGLRRVRRYSPSLLDTHPTELQRVGYLSTLESDSDPGEDDIENYRVATARVLPLLFDSLIKG